MVTDLDGTLLDPLTYWFSGAEEAIEWLKGAGVPIVFNSSKSRAEQEVYRRALGLRDPFVVENGAAIYYEGPVEGASKVGTYWAEVFGIRAENIRALIEDLIEEYRHAIRLIDEMSDEEISRITGLPPSLAGLARVREYSVVYAPIDREGAARMAEEVVARGLRYTFGGRLYVVTGPHHKGTALRALRARYPGAKIVALGDGSNDVEMLREADIPVLLGGREDVAKAIGREDLITYPGRGPGWWAKAVKEVVAPIIESMQHQPEP